MSQTLKPAKLVTITPALAQQMLTEKNVLNRPIRDKHVAALAKDMAEGRWKVNGDTICLGKTRLIDGQHRLWAVVMSEVTIQSFVVEGLDDDVFDTKDVGRRRTAADTLAVRGEKNIHRLSAALVMVDKYMTGRADISVAYSNEEVSALLDKYPGMRDCIQSSIKVSGLLPGSVVDACYYLFSQVDRALADDFIEKLKRGSGLVEGDPWYTLRERLLQNSLAKAKLSKPYLFAICIKAWNAKRTGHKLKVLVWRMGGDAPEAFPVIR